MCPFSICLFGHFFIHLSFNPSVYKLTHFMQSSIHPSVCPLTYFSIHPSLQTLIHLYFLLKMSYVCSDSRILSFVCVIQMMRFLPIISCSDSAGTESSTHSERGDTTVFLLLSRRATLNLSTQCWRHSAEITGGETFFMLEGTFGWKTIFFSFVVQRKRCGRSLLRCFARH